MSVAKGNANTSFERSSRKVVVIADDDDSDASVVSVAPTADPRPIDDAPVEMFGSIESDDEVRVQVRRTKPGNDIKRKVSSVRANRRPPGVRDDIVPSSEVGEELDGSDTGMSVASTERNVVMDKRRRSGGDDNDSPSKIRVKDLTLSPRKMPAEGLRVAVPELCTDETPGRRTSGRVRRPSARAAEAVNAVLVSERSDDPELGDSRTKRGDDDLYDPALDRRRRGGVKKAIVPLTNLQSLRTGGSMVSPTASEFGTFSALTAGSRFFDRSGAGSKLVPSSPGVSGGDNVSVEATPRGKKLGSGKASGGQHVEEREVKLDPPFTQSNNGLTGTKRSPVVGGRLGGGAGDDSPPEVFSGAVALPDEEEDESYSEEEYTGGSSATSTVVALLDETCIHPDLQDLYRSMPWINRLRRAVFVGYPNVNTDDPFVSFTPASYGEMLKTATVRVRSKLVRSVLFMGYKDFRNPVRAPLTDYVRNWECVRIPRKDGVRNAAFVLSGVCLQSYVSQGREVGPTFVKQLHVRPLENDWNILQCNFGSFFGDDQLHAPGRRNALVFQTKREGWVPKQQDDDKYASTPYSSPSKGSSEVKAKKAVEEEEEGGDDIGIAGVNILRRGAPPYRSFDEGIPLYDGRTKVGTKGFKFEPADWERYTELPLYPYPEVELDSLVTVVFTLTGFRGMGNVHHTVHFNALFAIVLGKV
ncbi:hypothetical protein VNI00_013136 [Paramarasmius palmivorus]|uniref:Uncharacterized protein n=1 Tax=Paramarasmius palmivorus TaxID=297713 RepID=A0AAW0C1W5_9AGAR